MQLILASASPRRAELLVAAGYSFDVHAVDVDERLRAGETASDYVERLAIEKAARAMEELLSDPAEAGLSGPAKAGHYVRDDDVRDEEHDSRGPAKAGHYARDLIVIGADTAVVVGEAILGKPRDVEDAARMLRRLSGRTHQVMTGVSARSTTADVSQVEVSTVTFAALNEEQIAWYVASGEGRDKAGAYAIQGLASRFIPRIEGSYSNIVGLPIAAVDGLIRRLSWPRTVLASRE